MGPEVTFESVTSQRGLGPGWPRRASVTAWDCGWVPGHGELFDPKLETGQWGGHPGRERSSVAGPEEKLCPPCPLSSHSRTGGRFVRARQDLGPWVSVGRARASLRFLTLSRNPVRTQQTRVSGNCKGTKSQGGLSSRPGQPHSRLAARPRGSRVPCSPSLSWGSRAAGRVVGGGVCVQLSGLRPVPAAPRRTDSPACCQRPVHTCSHT